MFDKLFNNKLDKEEKSNKALTLGNQSKSGYISSAPAVHYVHTANNRDKVVSKENDVLVLYWISKKKNGYEIASNSFPKWFEKQYGINFNNVLMSYLSEGCLSENNGILKITETGENKIRDFDYVIYVFEHPQYCLSNKDFINAPNYHRVQNSDITWGIFNSRIMVYTQKRMWDSLMANYANMADFLIEENRFERALDNIFCAAFLSTSGMKDNNELIPIMTEFTNDGYKKKYLSNGMPDIFMLEVNNYYVVSPFLKVQEKLNLTWDDIKVKYLESPYVANLAKILPFKYFEQEESFEIFKQAIIAGGKKGVFSLRDCNKKLKWNTPNEHSRSYFYASPENKANFKR